MFVQNCNKTKLPNFVTEDFPICKAYIFLLLSFFYSYYKLLSYCTGNSPLSPVNNRSNDNALFENKASLQAPLGK